MYEHLSGYVHAQTSATAVDIVEGAVSLEEAAVLQCLANANSVGAPYKLWLKSDNTEDDSMDSEDSDASDKA
jgi:hypothetical protein